jgi:UDPglucose--hexose-1-phosphate uridylyltransferase
MPELRRDVVSGRWVIIATERAARPTDFAAGREWVTAGDRDRCPFCPGREDHTPPEIYAVRPSGSRDGAGWRVRVVPNKYPALRIEGELHVEGAPLFEHMDAVGAHEVIVETPDHDTHLALLPDDQVADVLRTYRERYVDLDRDPRFQYALLFRNHGRTAGASLSHPHSQLIALPVVPRRAEEELEVARRYFADHARCVYCDVVSAELERGERVVYENDLFLAYEPYASRFPFETWVLPKYHQASFGQLEDEELVQLADALVATLHKLHAALDNPPYNFVVHSAPYTPLPEHLYHWHIEIMPRLTSVAGFEWGTGFYINVVPPEQAAAFLREAPARPAEERPSGVREPVQVHGEVGGR